MSKIIENNYHIHGIGIGGVSMSGLAILLKNMGFMVSGSDCVSTNITNKLNDMGIHVNTMHDKSNVDGVNACFKSLAIKEDNEEVQRCRELGVLMLERGEILAMIEKRYRKSIAISGVHGKSTTTAMLTAILEQADYDPTVHLGANYKPIGGSVKYSSSEYFITEACEYKRSFLSLNPYIAVILNVEYEHTDCYKNYDDILQAFDKFASKSTGYVLTTAEIKEQLSTAQNVITCGLSQNNMYRAEKITDKDGCYSYSLMKFNQCLGRINLNVMGEHNLINSLFASATADLLGVDFESIDIALSNFAGLDRRLENLPNEKGIVAISDYAHHPTEIASCIKSLKPLNKRIVAVFQPHTYSRTKHLIKQFSTAFDGVSRLFLLSTYPARESYDYLGSSEYLATQIRHDEVIYVENKKMLFDELDSTLETGDILLFIGAGDADLWVREYVGCSD